MSFPTSCSASNRGKTIDMAILSRNHTTWKGTLAITARGQGQEIEDQSGHLSDLFASAEEDLLVCNLHSFSYFV